MDKRILLAIENVVNELKKVNRRLETLQSSADLIYKDRELLEDIQASGQALKQIILLNQEHQDNNAQHVKADIKDVGVKVENKVDEVKNTMNEKTIIVKTTKENVFTKLRKLIGGE